MPNLTTFAKSLLPHRATHSQGPGLGYGHHRGEGGDYSAYCNHREIYAKTRKSIPNTTLIEATEIIWHMKMYTWSRQSGLNVKKVL